ncbi:hypothetical protein QOZ98_000071 [Planomicrobium stackebrandtii]|uniref:Uncharacterized protein n=1 Tax=Planomicrobium stackebrandtii TaxID=253160 RepID=A0ABU0GPG6_9BACL|nr:hypothetical protein [Planomicrobium stackebrandtii]
MKFLTQVLKDGLAKAGAAILSSVIFIELCTVLFIHHLHIRFDPLK